MPVRKVRPNQRSITGHLPVEGRLVAYESALERDFLVLISAEPDFLAIEEQPVTIPYRLSAGRASRYTPDFLVTYSGRQTELIEIKYRAELWAGWAGFKPKFQAATRWAQEQGARFRIVTDRHIRGHRLENLLWLRRYLKSQPDLAAATAILAALETGPESISALLQTSQDATITLWHLIATRQVMIDLTRPLNRDTLVSRPEEAP